MENNDKIKDNVLSLLEYIQVTTQMLVCTPEKVQTSYKEIDGNHFFVIDVKEGEQGQIIGKEGLIIASISFICRCMSTKEKMGKIFVDVNNKKEKETKNEK